MNDIEKLAKENGFVTYVADDGECYADIETLAKFAEFYAAKVLQEQNKSTEQSEPVMAIRLAINEILESGEKLPPNTRELVYFIKNVSGEILFQDPIAQVTKHGIFGIDRSTVFEVGTKLYTTPQRQQPLKRLDANKIGFIFRKEMTLFEFYNALMDATEELNHD